MNSFARNTAFDYVLFHHSPDAIIVVNIEGLIVRANPKVQAFFGYFPEDVIGKELSLLIPPSSKQLHNEQFQKYFENPYPRDMSGSDNIVGVHKDGHSVPLAVSLTPFSELGETHVLAVIQDTRDKRRLKAELDLHDYILSNLNDGVYLSDAVTGNILYANKRFEDMFGYESGELLGQDATIVNIEKKKQQISTETIKTVLNTEGYWEGDIEHKRKDNTTFWCFVKVSEIDHPKYGKTWVSIHSDITEKRFHAQKIWRQANYDELTQLPSRHYFTERVEQEIVHLKRSGGCFALLFIDLDNFKDINDSLGHTYGDALLMEVAARFEQTVRESDVVGRFGGDEFTIMLRDLDASKPEIIENLSDKLITAINAPFLLEGELVFISASIGISVYPQDGTDVDALYKFSDQAVSQAKNNGKNRVQFFTQAMELQARRNREVIRNLREAITLSQFEIYYQPIVHTQTGHVHKAEALIRWFHPIEGMISPAEFIPLAEETKLINEIGEYVLEDCILRLQRLRKEINPNFQISINKSPIQFQSNVIETEVAWQERMQRADVPCSALNIEITEGLLLVSEDNVDVKLKTLRDQGFQFSIDDFGTGYSALAYLKRIKVEFLKIDQAFIRTLDTVKEDQVLCEAIIVMAHKLGIQVIAEGVETIEHLNLLRDMGCDYCQGYYFSKPLPFSEFLTSLT